MFLLVRLGKYTKFIFCVLIIFLFCVLYYASPQIIYAQSKEVDVKVPVIMYHSILKDKSYSNDYTITPEQLENDFKYIKEKGYKTVTITDLVNFVYNNKGLPDKCIMITFDDGFYNNYYYAYPLLVKYDLKAVLSPVMVLSEEYSKKQENSVNYGYCSFSDLKEMVNSGHIELQNHSYDMHYSKGRTGINQKSGESFENYKSVISNDLKTAQELLKEITGDYPQCMTYPFGTFNENTVKVIKEMEFKASLSCIETTSIITKDKESLYNIGRYLRKNSYTTKQFFDRIGE